MRDNLHIHLDAVGGIAGDMFVAAMLDAFPDLRERVLVDVGAVLPEEVGAASLQEGMSGGLRALRFGLTAGDAPPGEDHDHGRFADLRARIADVNLSPGTARHAVAILTILAEAEARLHGVDVEAVHFHEIAGWDSLMDVVAAGSLSAALEHATWSVSDLPRGGGFVRARHGLLPVPAPATAAILEGFAWRDDGIPGERVTPTGAAILRHLVGSNGRGMAAGRLVATGTGAGTRELPGAPNILRVLAFAKDAEEGTTEIVAIVSFEIDDMTGEEIGVALDRLRAESGVLDASLSARTGKKGRPIQAIRLLVRPDVLEAVKARCFAETSTIGLRWRWESRACLTRRVEAVPVEGGNVRVKRVERPGSHETVKAESDDLARGPTLAERRRLAMAAQAHEP